MWMHASSHTHTHTHTGPADDPLEAREFLSKLFTDPFEHRVKRIPHHTSYFTCALDSESMRDTWEKMSAAFRNAFMEDHLRKWELL